MEQKTIVAVKGIVEHKGKYLVLRRSNRDGIAPCIWEFAGGKVEFGEGLEQALVREAKEETGLDIEVGNLLYTTHFLTSETRHVILLCYKCSAQTEKINLSFEHNEYMWVKKEELLSIVDHGIAANLIKYKVIDLL